MADAIAFALLLPVLIAATVTDLRTGKVYNVLTYPAILAGIGLWVIFGIVGVDDLSLGDALARCGFGLAAGLIPAAIVVSVGGLGGGDMKLLGAIGAISASWAVVLSTAVYALILALTLALVLMIATGRTKHTLRRLFGGVLQLVGRTRPAADPTAPAVPFALALALGGTLAGAEQLLNLHTPWAWITP